MKKTIFTASILATLGGAAFAAPIPQCEKVNLDELLSKLEDVVGTCDLGEEVKCFNEKIKGADRLCSRTIGGMDPKKLTGKELEIYNIFELIEKK